MSEDIKPIVGQGHPLDPNRHQVLSQDDEKRIDDKGRPIVEGKLWSDCSTGLYLVVALHSQTMRCDRVIKGQTEVDTQKDFKLTLGVTLGRPTFGVPVVGACLEIPEDLGTDKIKQQYVSEWLADTVFEAFDDRGVVLKSDETFTINLIECVAHASDSAIAAVGL